MIKQFPLLLEQKVSYTLENFVPGANLQPLAELANCTENADGQYLFLWGNSGTGKTHLATGTLRTADEKGKTVAFIPLLQSAELAPEMLSGLEQMDLICLDDIHAIAGIKEWEEAIFHLFNRSREQHCNLIITANCGPKSLEIKLPDLASRLASGTSYRLTPLDDSEKMELLVSKAGQLGMEMNHETARYILNNHSRDIASLLLFIKKLDHESLAAQRKLTIPFVRSLITP